MDIERAERFLSETARLLDRHRAAVLLHGAPPEPALRALLAYRNDDGGFGHALEPDVRDPGSQPAATVHALEVLSEIGVLDPPMVAGAAAWAAGVAHPDGSLPFVLPTAADSPHAPWMGPDDGPSFLTFGAVAAFSRAGVDSAWVPARRRHRAREHPAPRAPRPRGSAPHRRSRSSSRPSDPPRRRSARRCR